MIASRLPPGPARRFIAALVVVLFAIAPLNAAAQALIVPLTGRRIHDLQAAQLFHTLFSDFFYERDGTTYVQTGDIPAMWLRDSSAQTIPYIRFYREFPQLRSQFDGVIQRNARNVIKDPYANAFQASYHVWERKWEIDSLAWPVVLAWVYWRQTGDRRVFTPQFHVALRKIVDTYACERNHPRCGRYNYPYHVSSSDRYAATGMIWGAFRPSDDAVRYRFNIPQNALAVVALREIDVLARVGYRDARLSDDARSMAAGVMRAIEFYGRYYDSSQHQWTYAYETDGFGRYAVLDDANIPNLITLPYIDWCSAHDPTYLAARAMSLSRRDPDYYEGRYAAGLGSAHTPPNYVWPLGIIGRALTATSSGEVAEAVTTLAETDGELGTIHESFYDDGYWRYTRDEFGWANALGAELTFRTLAGYGSTQFDPGGPVLPLQTRSVTPALVTRPYEQLRNAAKIVTALGQLLHHR
ncbi:MAG TPA: glycoside hydrolase family 125 protein [Candidatus Tumulicola sp.]